MGFGAGGFFFFFFLRPFGFCQYHCPGKGDLSPFFIFLLGGRNPAVSCCAFTGLLLQPGGLLDSLRHDARPHLLRCWLHYSANMVVDRTAYFVSDHRSLAYCRFHLVEGAGTLVTPAAGRMSDISALEMEICDRLGRLSTLSTPAVRVLRREFSQRIAFLAADTVLQLAYRLLKKENVVPRFFSYELVQHHSGAARSLNTRR